MGLSGPLFIMLIVAHILLERLYEGERVQTLVFGICGDKLCVSCWR